MTEDHLGHWAGYAHESAFKFQKSVTTDGNDFEVRIGRLSWNPEEAKLVVIDGQHRAMVLIAIDRTLNNTWPGTGEKYRHFYEPVINDILKDLKSKNLSVDFSKVEFPVNIVWFPKLDYPSGRWPSAYLCRRVRSSGTLRIGAWQVEHNVQSWHDCGLRETIGFRP